MYIVYGLRLLQFGVVYEFRFYGTKILTKIGTKKSEEELFMLREEDIKKGFVFVLPYERNESIDAGSLVYKTYLKTESGDGWKMATKRRPLFSVERDYKNSARVSVRVCGGEDKDYFLLLKRDFLLEKGEPILIKDILAPLSSPSEQGTDDVQRFESIIKELLDTYKRKNHDYGNSFSKLFVECGMTYAYGHMAEKLERVKSLMKGDGQVKGESMKDSLYDLANYAILTIMEIEKGEQ